MESPRIFGRIHSHVEVRGRVEGGSCGIFRDRDAGSTETNQKLIADFMVVFLRSINDFLGDFTLLRLM